MRLISNSIGLEIKSFSYLTMANFIYIYAYALMIYFIKMCMKNWGVLLGATKLFNRI